VLVSNYYYRIRCEAAMALMHVSVLDLLLFLRIVSDAKTSVRCSETRLLWGCFICSNCSFATATTRKTPIKIYSLILTSQSPTTSLTWRNTLFGRCVLRLLFQSSNSAYFQSLIHAISQVRFENGKTPSVVRQFLIDQLRYNDNTANPVSRMRSRTATNLISL
jgi:hypothetical protein